MMKKVLFALAVLCTGFWSCNTLDLNDVGYGDGDRLKASSVKEILYGTADGCWKADYQWHWILRIAMSICKTWEVNL